MPYVWRLENNFRNHFSSYRWVPRIKLRLLGLIASSFITEQSHQPWLPFKISFFFHIFSLVIFRVLHLESLLLRVS